jgi:hypothetical protein
MFTVSVAVTADKIKYGDADQQKNLNFSSKDSVIFFNQGCCLLSLLACLLTLTSIHSL